MIETLLSHVSGGSTSSTTGSTVLLEALQQALLVDTPMLHLMGLLATEEDKADTAASTCEVDAEAAVTRFVLAAGLPSDSGGSVEVARVREAIATQVVAAQRDSGSKVASAVGVMALLDSGDGPNAAAPSATAGAGAAPTVTAAVMVAEDPVPTPADGAAEEAVITLSSQLPSKAGAEAAVEHAERRRKEKVAELEAAAVAAVADDEVFGNLVDFLDGTTTDQDSAATVVEGEADIHAELATLLDSSNDDDDDDDDDDDK